MDSGVATFRASTVNLRGKHEIDAFREHYGRTIFRLEMTPLNEVPLACDVAIRAVADVAIATGTLSPVRSYHPEDLGDDGFVLAVLHAGQAEFRHGHSLMALKPGDALLATSADATTYTGHTMTRLTNFRLKREVLATHVASPEASLGLPIAGNHYALRLLLGYAGALADPEVAMSTDACRIVSANIHDLVALAIDGTRDARAHTRGVQAARLYAIKADIQKSLGQADLSIQVVARRQEISPGYVGHLFATEGMSFSQYLLAQRLTRANRLLADPRHAHRTISSIAFDVGFGDLSYFNRTFRRRYGMTPSDVRAGSTA